MVSEGWVEYGLALFSLGGKYKDLGKVLSALSVPCSLL